MRLVLTVLIIATTACTTFAQRCAWTAVLDSPVKMEPSPSYGAGEVIFCSLSLPSSAALFGIDRVTSTSPTFLTNELFSPFRVFHTDADCQLISTWSTLVVAGTTATGIGVPNADSTLYWLCDPFGSSLIIQYGIGSGIPTGMILPTPVGGSVWGGLVVDDNQSGEIMCLNEIALDLITCVDANAGGGFVCLYSNADNLGGGAFGNGISDALTPSDCSGQTLVNPSGTITEGQVTRAGQYDCTGADPSCRDRWDLTVVGSTFINGIAEFDPTGVGPSSSHRDIKVVDNVTSTLVRLCKPVGVVDCQDTDPLMKVVFVNGTGGGVDFTRTVRLRSPLTVAVAATLGGNGRFVHNMNAGRPSANTVGALFDLGNQCFPFVNGSAVVVENNLGRTNRLGSSNYFGRLIADPLFTPLFLPSLLQPVIDAANLPVGSSFTHQAILANAAAASQYNVSLSNAVVMEMID